MSDTESLQLPIIAAITEDGCSFVVGTPPMFDGNKYGVTNFNELLKTEGAFNFDDSNNPKHLVVNSIHERPAHIMVELLTETGLESEELDNGIRAVSMIMIPMSNISILKAGYIRAIPQPENEDDAEDRPSDSVKECCGNNCEAECHEEE